MLDPELVVKLMATGGIEVAPLAYMRGRTLNDSFVVLDEAQNTTPEQMKMFLTRLGFGSKMVVTGDITQVDLPAGATQLADPPPESSTSTRSSAVADAASSSALAALSMLPWSGTGWPAAIIGICRVAAS